MNRFWFSTSLVVVCLAFACLAFLSISLFAAQVEAQAKLQYESNVTLKLVQVYVLDKHGNAVTDLTKGDFDLYDEGQAEPITDFEKHELSLDQAALVLKPAIPSAAVSNTNRKFFFFFDFAFNNRAGISKSSEAALDFLDKQVRPEDQIGILSYSAKQGLTLQEYLTSNHERIRQVIKGLGAGKFLGRSWGIQSEGLKEHLAMDEALAKGGPRSMTGGVPGMTDKLLTVETSVVKREAFSFTSQFSDLAKTLRGIPGIKNIILFSSGIPNYALYGSKYLPDETGNLGRNPYGDAALRDIYNEMCKELAGSNSAIYAVNVSRAGGAPIENPYEPDPTGAERDLKGDIALKQLAEDSGGKYFDSINSYKDINKTIQKTTGTYYVLGYYIDEKRDGRFHNVRVEVKRKGCTVFGQKGYFDSKPFSEYSENEKLLYIMDLALADNPLLQVPAEVPLTALPIVDKGKPAIIAFLSLPRRLAASALGSRAEALFLTYDEIGEAGSSIPLQITNPHLDKEFFQFIFIAPVRPGRCVCRIALCNMKTGYGVRGEKTITVPEARETALWLDPPLFLTGRGNEDTYASPGISLENLYAYDPQEYSVLAGDVPAGTKALRAALRVTSLRPNAEIELTAHLAETGGAGSESVPIDILRESADGLTKKFLVELATGELKPGLYTLSLIAKEKNGQAVAWTAATFTVK